jgi:hypothetical protein
MLGEAESSFQEDIAWISHSITLSRRHRLAVAQQIGADRDDVFAGIDAGDRGGLSTEREQMNGFRLTQVWGLTLLCAEQSSELSAPPEDRARKNSHQNFRC